MDAASPTGAGPQTGGALAVPLVDQTRHRARIRLRMTQHCRMLGLIIALMVVAAINYQSNAAWGLVLALLAMLGLSALHARRSLYGVTLAGASCLDSFAGEETVATLRLAADPGGDAIDIGIRFLEAPEAVGRVCLVLAGSSVEVLVPMPPARRGIYRFTRIRLSSTYPFGLIEASCDCPGTLTRIVYPLPHGRPAQFDHTVDSTSGASDRRQRSEAPGSDDFLGHRRYEIGESQRQVDWKAHARGVPLLVKRFAGAGGPARWCDWDDTSGPREARLSQLALWIQEAHRSGASFALLLPEMSLPPLSGIQHYQSCLQALAAQPKDRE